MRPWAELFPAGQPFNLANLIDAELNHYFPFADIPKLGVKGDMPFAAQNVSRGLGMNPGAGNPIADFTANRAANYATTAADLAALGPNPLDSTQGSARGALADIVAAMTGGKVNAVADMGGFKNALTQAGNAMNEWNTDKGAMDISRAKVGERLNASPKEMLDFIQRSMAGVVNPMLMRGSNDNKFLNDMETAFRLKGSPTGNLSQFILDMYRR